MTTEEIAKYRRLAGSTNATASEMAKKKLKEAGVSLTEGKSEPESKPKAKKEKPAKEPKKKKPKAEVKMDGKNIEEFDCDELIAKVKARREKAKKSGKKSKSKPVMEKVSSHITTAITTAIKNIPAEDLKDDPKGMASKIDTLIENAKKFTASFKAVLGEDYDKNDAMQDFKDLEAMVDKLEAKYKKK